MTMSVRLQGYLAIQSEVAEDDSDKTFTVPAGFDWEVLSIHVDFTTTATVGNRRIAVQVTDASDNILARVQAGAVQAASGQVLYNFAPGLADQTSAVNGTLNSALPKCHMAAGWKLRVYDIGAVDAAADDMLVRVVTKVLPR